MALFCHQEGYTFLSLDFCKMPYLGTISNHLIVYHARSMAPKLGDKQVHHLQDLKALPLFDEKTALTLCFKTPTTSGRFSIDANLDPRFLPYPKVGARGIPSCSLSWGRCSSYQLVRTQNLPRCLTQFYSRVDRRVRCRQHLGLPDAPVEGACLHTRRHFVAGFAGACQPRDIYL